LGIADTDADNPIWSFPGFNIEKARSWGLVSADIVNRTAGEVVWRSDYHRIVYALTDIPGTIQNDDGPAQRLPLRAIILRFVQVA
jgi:hypothetical protein